MTDLRTIRILLLPAQSASDSPPSRSVYELPAFLPCFRIFSPGPSLCFIAAALTFPPFFIVLGLRILVPRLYHIDHSTKNILLRKNDSDE